MANRNFQTHLYSLLKGLVFLAPIVSVGAAGAVTLKKRQFYQAGTLGPTATNALVNAPTTGVDWAVGDGAGTRSVSRSDTGDWTITLSDSYVDLVGVWILGQVLAAPGSLVALAVATIDSTNVSTNTGPNNGGVINITLNDETAAADPADGTILTLGILLGNSTAK